MLFFEKWVEFWVHVLQCVQTVGTNRLYCASLHQAPCGQTPPALHTTWPTYHCSTLHQVRLEEKQKSCGGAVDEKQKLWKSWKFVAFQEHHLHIFSGVSHPIPALFSGTLLLGSQNDDRNGTWNQQVQSVKMHEDNMTRWKKAVSIGGSFLIENLLRSTVRETLTEKEENGEEEAENRERSSPSCTKRGESPKYSSSQSSIHPS